MIAQTLRRALPAGALLTADRTGPRTPIECGSREAQASEPIRPACAAHGPLPLSALATLRAHPVVVGLLRTDLLRVVWNLALAQAVVDAEERAIRAVADQHQWRMVTVLGLQPGTGGITDPIKYLLDQVRSWRADVVVVPDRMHLTDLRGHDCLEAVCRECAVATTSPEQQLWTCTAGVATVSSGSLP